MGFLVIFFILTAPYFIEASDRACKKEIASLSAGTENLSGHALGSVQSNSSVKSEKVRHEKSSMSADGEALAHIKHSRMLYKENPDLYWGYQFPQRDRL